MIGFIKGVTILGISMQSIPMADTILMSCYEWLQY